MVSSDGISNSHRLKELEHQNYLLRLHNLRLLAQLEKRQNGPGRPDAVIVIEVKQTGEV